MFMERNGRPAGALTPGMVMVTSMSPLDVAGSTFPGLISTVISGAGAATAAENARPSIAAPNPMTAFMNPSRTPRAARPPVQ